MVAALGQLMCRLEADPAVTVVVFGVAVEDFVIADFETMRGNDMAADPVRGLPVWPDLASVG